MGTGSVIGRLGRLVLCIKVVVVAIAIVVRAAIVAIAVALIVVSLIAVLIALVGWRRRRLVGQIIWRQWRRWRRLVVVARIDQPASRGRQRTRPASVSFRQSLGAGGAAELVNYRVSGRYLIVDRLFHKAELRLGAGRRQVRVKIENRKRGRS